jgi:hypothetical protein
VADEEDIRDTACFRLWIKLAEKTPVRVAKALAHCIRAEDYRRALVTLAVEEGMNLPPLPRRLCDPCPYPDQPGWSMADCFAAQRCACAEGVRLGYKPTTMPISDRAYK